LFPPLSPRPARPARPVALPLGLLLAAVLLGLGPAPATGRAAPLPESDRRGSETAAVVVLEDFEGDRLSRTWTAVRRLTARRAPLPEAITPDAWRDADADAPRPAGARPQPPRPRGSAVQVETDGSAGLFTRAGAVRADWSRAVAMNVWIHVAEPDDADAGPVVIEAQFYERDGAGTRFWRKLELKPGWQHVRVPMRWCRWGGPQVPRWSEVDRFGLWFRGPAEVWVDSLALELAESDDVSVPLAEDLLPIAWPDPDARKAATVTRDGAVALLTDVPDLDAGAIKARLARAVHAMRDTLGKAVARMGTTPEDGSVTLIVFQREREYRTFPLRLAEAMHSEAAPARADGYTLHGVATSYYKPELGSDRPVWVHEYVHAYVARWLGLPNRNEWFHEALATWIQLRFHPQEGVEKIVHRGVADPTLHLPLKRLTDGDAIPLDRYWQAMTVLDMLITDDALAPHLPAILAHFRDTGSTNLQAALDAVRRDAPELPTWPRFVEQWRAHAAAWRAPTPATGQAEAPSEVEVEAEAGLETGAEAAAPTR